LGRYDNAYKNNSKQQGSSFGANVNDSVSDSGDKQIMARLGARQGDLISYESPTIAGFTANASYNLGRDSTNSISGGSANNTAKNTVATDLMPQFSLGLGYKNDNFSVGVGVTSVSNASWELAGNSAATAKVNTLGGQDLRAFQIGAEYRLGDFQFGAVSETTSSSFNSATLANNFDQSQLTNAFVLGYKKDRLEAQFKYALANDVSGTKGAGKVVGDTGANQYSLGVGYQLHKNAKLVASYTRVNNGSNASYTSGSGFSLSKGSDLDLLAFGLSVAF
jgi:predicted porin